MIEHDEMLSGSESYTIQQLIELYNDAVELIWLLRERIAELETDLEQYQQAVDELPDQLYG